MNIIDFPEVGRVGDFRLPLYKMSEKARSVLLNELKKVAVDFENYGVTRSF